MKDNTRYTMKEIKEALKSQGYTMEKSKIDHNSSPTYWVWNSAQSTKNFANLYTKSGIVKEFILGE